MEKFPDHIDFVVEEKSENGMGASALHGSTNGSILQSDSWTPRRVDGLHSYQRTNWATPSPVSKSHGRQKSLGGAFKTIRGRRASVSANVHEIADALKAPVSAKLIILCIMWYMSSALTNTSSKSILTGFPRPATLTIVQFAFVSSYCLLFSWLARVFPAVKATIPALQHPIRPPTRDVIMSTLPLAVFQIGGHLLSSTATAKIPVSLVHTIKGLSPLFTVLAYRVIFDIRYPITTYLSLVPLTLGVMLACSAEFRGNIFGILCAFMAAIIFVTQNIFSKRLFNEAAKAEADGQHPRSHRLDKLNLLCYSSGLAYVLTFPIWFWSEGLTLISDFLRDGSLDLTDNPEAFDHGRLAMEFIFNGIFHFGQNIMAFILLSLVSPVTYSVASLIKRVFVVVIAIIWFRNNTTPIQAFGIVFTFFGLYLYDRTSSSNKADRRARMMDIKGDTLLPTANAKMTSEPSVFNPPSASGYTSNEGSLSVRPQAMGNSTWVPPSPMHEGAWLPTDVANGGLP